MRCCCELVGALGVLLFMLVFVDWECAVEGIIEKKVFARGGGGGGGGGVDTFRNNLYQARQFYAWVVSLVIP